MKIKLFFTICFVICHFILSATQFTPKDKSVIYTEGISILLQYEETINNIGDVSKNSIDETKSYGESLNNLFINRKIMVYNDLDPKHLLSEFYEIETYTSNLILWYPDGIQIDLDIDNIKSTDIIQHEENIFSFDLMVDKRLDGNYLNKSINKNTEKLNFRIAFNKDGNDYKNYKIVGIRNANSQTMIDDKKALDQVNSAGLSEEEVIKANQFIITALNDYQNFMFLLGDKNELEEDKVFYWESLNGLFSDENTLVYNDLEKEPEKPAIMVKEYLRLYKEYYPDGIINLALNIDSADFGTIIQKDNGTFYTNVYIDKFFSGKFKGKEMHRFASELIFKINFEKAGNSYKNFIIESIDVSSMDFYGEGEDGEIEVPSIDIKPISRKGLFMGINLPVGISMIKDINVENKTLDEDYYNWNVENSLSYYNGGLELGYYFNNHFGIGSGITYNSYSSKFILDGRFEDQESSLDLNSEPFYKNVEAEYDSIISFNQLSVPLTLRINTSGPKKFGYFVNSGFNFIYIIKSSYKVEGDYKYFGSYPGRSEPYNIVENPDFGFTERIGIDTIADLTLKKINLSYTLQAGVCIPLNYYSNIYIGPFIDIGITDLSDSDIYIDIFGRKEDREKITFMKYGLQISFNIKL
ncbi:outer membrane beta-barrel protein [Bacteroidota bacterium]